MPRDEDVTNPGAGGEDAVLLGYFQTERTEHTHRHGKKLKDRSLPTSEQNLFAATKPFPTRSTVRIGS